MIVTAETSKWLNDWLTKWKDSNYTYHSLSSTNQTLTDHEIIFYPHYWKLVLWPRFKFY